MVIDITITPGALKQLPVDFRKREIRRLAKKIIKAIEELNTEALCLSLLITDDRHIAELNSTYRHKAKPTDVLSFPAPSLPPATSNDDREPTPLGDIAISIETAARQARSFNVALQTEMTRLLTHGILHLLGYEHEKVPSHIAKKMRKMEEDILQRLTS